MYRCWKLFQYTLDRFVIILKRMYIVRIMGGFIDII